MLAGLNFPVSEDLVVIGSAVLAATIVPQNFYYLLVCAYLGVYLSDLESYWLARILGRKALRLKFTARIVSPQKLEKVKYFLDKYGALALAGGRFIPFGFRNALFMTCGLSKMKFWKFALGDFVASVITTTILFSLGYSFGKNYPVLLDYLTRWKFYIIITVFAITVLVILIRFGLRHRKRVA
jgi:membrane protein DedA with SNARE-associated domain